MWRNLWLRLVHWYQHKYHHKGDCSYELIYLEHIIDNKNHGNSYIAHFRRICNQCNVVTWGKESFIQCGTDVRYPNLGKTREEIIEYYKTKGRSGEAAINATQRA